MQVRPRSGLALKRGITCLNTPGTIDSDYRGEVKVILANLGNEPFAVIRGERIAQLIPALVQRAVFDEVAALDDTARKGTRIWIDRAVMPALLLPLLLLVEACADGAIRVRARSQPVDQMGQSARPPLSPAAADHQRDEQLCPRTKTRARGCTVQRHVKDKSPAIRIEVAVLVHPEDGVRASVPHPTGCALVEHYTAGLVTSFARNNLAAPSNAAEQWYRATITSFIWTK